MLKQTRNKLAQVRVLLTTFALLLALQPALASEKAQLLEGVVNVNTANTEELQLLPGVGEVRAKAILEVRKSKGGFKAVTDLTDVKGIGDAMVEIIRPYVTLSGKTTARRL